MNRLRAILNVRELRRKLGIRATPTSKSRAQRYGGKASTPSSDRWGVEMFSSYARSTSGQQQRAIETKSGDTLVVRQNMSLRPSASDTNLLSLEDAAVQVEPPPTEIAPNTQSSDEKRAWWPPQGSHNGIKPDAKRLSLSAQIPQPKAVPALRSISSMPPSGSVDHKRLPKQLNPPALTRSQSLGHRSHVWSPEKGDVVKIKGIGSVSKPQYAVLHAPYRGVVDYMRRDGYWWFQTLTNSSEAGSGQAHAQQPLRVAPLKDIQCAPDGVAQRMRKEPAIRQFVGAWEVFDKKKSEKAREEESKLRLMLSNAFGMTLAVPEAREHLLHIVVDPEQKNAILFAVDAQAFERDLVRQLSANEPSERLGSEPLDSHCAACDGEVDAKCKQAKLRALAIYKAFVIPGSPLEVTCLSGKTRAELNKEIKGRVLTASLFAKAHAEAVQYIRTTAWKDLTRLWLIIAQLWRQGFPKADPDKHMERMARILRGYLPKAFLRFFGSPALNIGDNGIIDEQSIFKEGVLSKKFLTRAGYARRYVRIQLEHPPDAPLPQVMLCYYDTVDDENPMLWPDLRIEINELFTVSRDTQDLRAFHVRGSSYQKERGTANALMELASHGLTLRAESRKERDEWVDALVAFIPTVGDINKTTSRIIKHVAYILNHEDDFFHGARWLSRDSPMGRHHFLFKRFPDLHDTVSDHITTGLMGTLRELFAEQWDPALGSAWRFLSAVKSSIQSRTRLRFSRQSCRTLFHGDARLSRRGSVMQSLRNLFGKRARRQSETRTGSLDGVVPSHNRRIQLFGGRRASAKF